MKIISNKGCYIQGSDIENIVYFESNIRPDISSKLGLLLTQSRLGYDKYFKIEDSELLEYILSSDLIPDFSDLNRKSISELDILVLKLKIAIDDLDYQSGEHMTQEEINKALIDSYKEKKNREYMLSQIKEAIAYKKRTSKVEYPDVPNPCETPIMSDNLVAIRSINYQNIVIYDVNGKPVSEDDDKEFCKIAFEMIIEEETDASLNDLELDYSLSEDKKSLIVSKHKKEKLDNNKKMTRKLKLRK